jgi:SAM-dependent methyltransferase
VSTASSPRGGDLPAPAWADGDAYEAFMGRWSRKLAPRFVAWAQLPQGARVLDVGCGTGALSEALLAGGAGSVVGIDFSAGFVAAASRRVSDPRARFGVGDAQSLPEPDASFDAAVSGLTLNFVPDPARAAREMVRVTRPGNTVAAYLWDLADQMEILRHFWDAAVECDPRASPLHEGRRFPICKPEPLDALFRGAGLVDVSTGGLVIDTPFASFDAYWGSFQGGQGPAPGYVRGLDPEARDRLREALRLRVSPAGRGPVALKAKAWAVKGRRPD